MRLARDLARSWRLMLVTGSFVGLVVACTTDYQLGANDPIYGAPNALENQKPPRPFLETATGEGGASSSGSTTTPACVTKGGTLAADAGAPCAVSFKNDVLKIFGTAQAPSQACNSAECHGGASPYAQPRIDPGAPDDTWLGFQKFTAGGKDYVNPCSVDPAVSSILCNVAATGSCGSKMPKGGGQIPQADLDKIDAWVKCGAPNN